MAKYRKYSNEFKLQAAKLVVCMKNEQIRISAKNLGQLALPDYGIVVVG